MLLPSLIRVNTFVNSNAIIMNIDFDKEVLEASKERAVLVSYSAGYCGSCKYLNQSLKQIHLASESGSGTSSWKYLVIDAQENLDLVEEWDVVNVPHLFIYKNERVIGERVGGAMSKAELQTWLDEYIPS